MKHKRKLQINIYLVMNKNKFKKNLIHKKYIFNIIYQKKIFLIIKTHNYTNMRAQKIILNFYYDFKFVRI